METPSDDPQVEETAAADTAAEESSSPEATEAAAAEPAAPAEPVVPLTPKERKAAARARRGKRRGATPEERAEERAKKAAARRRRRLQEREKKRASGEAGPKKTESPLEHGPGRPKERLGHVVSDRADKTIVVRIDTARRHRKYQKIVRSSSTLHAHDEANTAGIGDLVRVIESRPLSATKRWRLVEVLEKAK